MGWDCNRHYEAGIAQSVPVMNQPTIIRHAPLLEGVHGVYYDVEPGGLERAAVAALADKDRLKTMAIAARDHVFAHHIRRAYCERMLRMALECSLLARMERSELRVASATSPRHFAALRPDDGIASLQIDRRFDDVLKRRHDPPR